MRSTAHVQALRRTFIALALGAAATGSGLLAQASQPSEDLRQDATAARSTPDRAQASTHVHETRRSERHLDRRAAARRKLRHDFKQSGFRDSHGSAFHVPTNDRVHVVMDRHPFDWGALDKRQPLQGCPPALASGTACAPSPPPVLPASLIQPPPPRPWAQPGWYLQDQSSKQSYSYVKGYLLDMSAKGAVASYVPLLGGALSVGAIWPTAWQDTTLPDYYASYYDLGAAGSYRYSNDAIYRVTPQTGAITAIAALLTGSTIAVGKVMPAGFEIYNVPYGYRDQYVDSADALYRYNDGYIYQLDPKTRMVRAAIEMLD